MPYALHSSKTGSEHDIAQWNARTLEGELRSFEGRTLVDLFDKYLGNTSCHILEGGCGFGAWCEWFEDRGHRIIGVEYDHRVVARAHDFKADVSVELGDVTDLRYPDDHFDAYVSLGVVEHFKNGPSEALLEAHRILKPGGLAFVTTPCLTVGRRLVAHPVRSLYFWIRRLRRQPSYFWEYRFSPSELCRFLSGAGFEIVCVQVDDYHPTVRDRHIGLSADWFFLRNRNGEIWQLNGVGRAVLRLLRYVPTSWYCSGVAVVARAKTGATGATDGPEGPVATVGVDPAA